MVLHVPGKDTTDVYMSRHLVGIPVLHQATVETENFVDKVVNNFGPRAVRIFEIIEATNKDQELIKLCKRSYQGEEQIKKIITSQSHVLDHVDKTISLPGIAKIFKTDNDSPFNGYEFKNFVRLLVLSIDKTFTSASKWPS